VSRHFILAIHVALPGSDDKEEEMAFTLLQDRIKDLPEFKALDATMEAPEQV
jgi:hypothetical protein